MTLVGTSEWVLVINECWMEDIYNLLLNVCNVQKTGKNYVRGEAFSVYFYKAYYTIS